MEKAGRLPQSPVVLVTGATDGIGRETARELARRGARVIPHGRNAARVEEVRTELAAIRPESSLAGLIGDLSDLSTVGTMVRELEGRAELPDVLLSNAGVFATELKTVMDGLELSMVVNHLSHYLMGELLLSSPAGARLRRIVNVSSMAHMRGTVGVVEDPCWRSRAYDGYVAYCDAKLANVLHAVAWAPRLAGRGITINALHPGVVTTKLLTTGFGIEGRESLAQGAETSVMLALEPGVDGVTGRYFVARRESRPQALAQDAAFAARFDAVTRTLLGLAPVA
jgi:NAD(P)-dependent dehydrogenase (short-subunit alcohol dehydrogenase family)